MALLDRIAPLAGGASHADARRYAIVAGALVGDACRMAAASASPSPATSSATAGDAAAPEAILFVHHGLHVEMRIDRDHPIGKDDPAGIADLVLEAAVTTIMDLRGLVAAVDAEDKVAAYRNWLGLMNGSAGGQLREGRQHARSRRLNPDRTYTAPDGGAITLHGRALMLVRNVGHLMT